jgi:hypothetical protein
MPKPSKQQLSDKMQERNPLDMRQQIIPVDILATEVAQRTDRPNNESELMMPTKKPNTDTERSTERLKRTEDTNNKTDSLKREKNPNTNTEEISEPMMPTINPNTDIEHLTERLERTEDTNNKTDSLKRGKNPNTNTEEMQERKQQIPNKLNTRTDGSKRTVLQELRQGVEETTTPRAERYSFEIYPDQKDRIKELQNLYQRKTGRKLSASRILREGLDMYLEKAFHLLNEKTEK